MIDVDAGVVKESCATCRFGQCGTPPLRRCRRYPPTVFGRDSIGLSNVVDSRLPTVRDDDWCGEFQAHEAGGAE